MKLESADVPVLIDKACEAFILPVDGASFYDMANGDKFYLGRQQEIDPFVLVCEGVRIDRDMSHIQCLCEVGQFLGFFKITCLKIDIHFI